MCYLNESIKQRVVDVPLVWVLKLDHFTDLQKPVHVPLIYIYILYIYYIYIDIYYIHTYTYIRYSKICHLYDRYILFTYMLLLICYYSVPCGVRSHEPWIWYSVPVVITILQLQSTKSETLKKTDPKTLKRYKQKTVEIQQKWKWVSLKQEALVQGALSKSSICV